MSCDICGDNRFEIIERAKRSLIESTNIETSEDEMKVIDSFLFRCWQMGWLDKYDYEEPHEIGYTHGQMADRPKGEWIKKQVFNPELDKYVPLIECSVCGYEPYFGGSESKFNYCANCGADMRGKKE